MMRSLAEALEPHKPANVPLKDLAVLWLKHFEGKDHPWTVEEITTRMAGCFNDQPSAVRFFFGDLERAMVFLDLLNIPRMERMEFFERADEIMSAHAGEKAGMVIDATLWGAILTHPDPFYNLIRVRFIEPGLLKPVTLILTEMQHKRLPTPPPSLQARLTIDVQPSAETAWGRVHALAGDHALVISSRPFPVFERWIAGRYDGKHIALEPAEGIQLFAAQGRLPGLPPLTHDLADILGDKPLPQVKLPGNPLELRKLMISLRTEEGVAKLKLAPEVRQACARVLGIKVTSTAQERADAAANQVGRDLKLEVKPVSEAELKRFLARAKKEPTGATALRVGSTLHLINPSKEQAAAAPAGTKIHTFTKTTPMMRRLLDALEPWTEDDYAEDPGLLSLLPIVDPNGHERLSFLHARACLLWCQAYRPKPTILHKQWRSILIDLLEGEPPPATLRVRAVHNRDKYKGWTQPRMFAALDTMADHEWPPETKHLLNRLTPEAQRLLRMAPLPGGFRVSREDRIEAHSYHKRWYGEFEGGLVYKDPPPPSILIPEDPEQVRDPDLWWKLFTGSAAFHGPRDEGWHAPAGHRFKLLKGLEYWQTAPIVLDDEYWRTLDHELALAWLAIRQAAGQVEAVSLHDGTALLPVGAGIFAEITLSPSGRPPEAHRETSAGFEITCELAFSGKPEGVMQDFRAPVITHLASTETSLGTSVTRLGYSLPTRLHLSGKGFNASISFRASPFFMGQSSSGLGAAAASAGAQNLAALHEWKKREEAGADSGDDS